MFKYHVLFAGIIFYLFLFLVHAFLLASDGCGHSIKLLLFVCTLYKLCFNSVSFNSLNQIINILIIKLSNTNVCIFLFKLMSTYFTDAIILFNCCVTAFLSGRRSGGRCVRSGGSMSELNAITGKWRSHSSGYTVLAVWMKMQYLGRKFRVW